MYSSSSANFKDIVMFSIKTCSIPLNKQYSLNKNGIFEE
jgi:hypothetical protein